MGWQSPACNCGTQATPCELEERYRLLVESSPDAILLTQRGLITFANPAAIRLMGSATAEDLLGRPITALIHPGSHAAQERARRRLETGDRNLPPIELQYVKLDGTLLDLEVSIAVAPLKDEMAIQIHCRDISSEKRARAQLLQLVDHDVLTNLYNRRRFRIELENRLGTPGLQGALLLIDLDHFKYVNDTLGHQAGDRLLQSVAALIQRSIRPTDVVCRLSGDEFAILLCDLDESRARVIAEAILQTISSHTEPVKGFPLRITASIGLAPFAGRCCQVEDLLAEADLAMNQVKESGRNGVAVYTPETGQKAQMESKLTWESRIRTALEQDRFVLRCQPICHLPTGQIRAYELLLRMQGANRELIAPAAFLETAERFGMITAVDRWVVRNAIRLLADLRASARQFTLEVNLSGRSVHDPDLMPMIRRELEEQAVDPSRLIFEITETTAIGDLSRAREFIEALRELGCRFALDDFGAGFSSFYYLKQLPVDFLKLDGSFIQNLASDQTDQHLVRAMVAVARGLGKQTVAEFVGDERTMELLREFGVDFAQGNHVGRPGPLCDLWVSPSSEQGDR